MALAKIEITSVTLQEVPGVNQTFTFKYRKKDDPDVEASYTTVTTTQVVNTAGVLQPKLTINNLPTGTWIVVRAINNCDGNSTDKEYLTPLPSCVKVIDIIGTVSEQ